MTPSPDRSVRRGGAPKSRLLDWIEHLASNQRAGGSNPSGCTPSPENLNTSPRPPCGGGAHAPAAAPALPLRARRADAGAMEVDRARLALIASQLQDAAQALQPKSRTETVAAAVEEYKASRAPLDRESTQKNRAYRLARLVRLFGELPLAELTEDDLGMYLAGYPAASQPNVQTVVFPFIRWAARHGWPGLDAVVPKRTAKSRARHRHMSPREYGAALVAVQGMRRQPRKRSVTVDCLHLAVLTPLRGGEIVSLRASNVGSEGRRLHLVETKTGDRTVPLSPVARAIVLRRRDRAKGEGRYLFPAARGAAGHFARASLSHAWRRDVALPLGMPDVSLHTCRHSWASFAIDSGEPMEWVRRMLGHSSEHMTAKYTHVSDRRLAEVSDRVERGIVGCGQHQLELPMSEEHPARTLERLTPTQRSVLCDNLGEFRTTNPGVAQAAIALVRRGLFQRVAPKTYARTELGQRIAAEGGAR